MPYALDTSLTPIWVKITFLIFAFFSFLAMVGFIGFRWKDGLWGAILLSFNLLFATLITMNYYEALGKMLASKLPVGLFYWDSLVFIILLIITFSIFNLITNRLSRVNVAFPKILENIVLPFYLLAIWFFQFVPLTFFVLLITATAPYPVAGTIGPDRGIGGDLPIQVINYVASTGSLSTFNGPNEWEPLDSSRREHGFWSRQYARRCALLIELYSTGNSRFSGKAEFLE